MMNKEIYEKTDLEIIKFQTEDVIMSSSFDYEEETRYETPRI